VQRPEPFVPPSCHETAELTQLAVDLSSYLSLMLTTRIGRGKPNWRFLVNHNLFDRVLEHVRNYNIHAECKERALMIIVESVCVWRKWMRY